MALAQLPVGPSVGAGAAVLILGSDGVAAAAAAGVLLTATGTVGGLCFAAWAGAEAFDSRFVNIVEVRNRKIVRLDSHLDTGRVLHALQDELPRAFTNG